MRVLYVRPSDNGNYGVEHALDSLLRRPEQVHVALCRGLRLPLEARNFDPAEHGFAALNAYDLVILAGLDPIVLSPQDNLALIAFVERGGALLLVGGTHSFSNAEGTYFPLGVMLPVQVLRALDVEVNALPQPTEHPIARGLPEPLGYISKVHPTEPKPGAEVALTVADLPLVVAGEYGYGRVAVLASYPECEETEYGWFFTGDAFDDFVRNTVAWLTKEQQPVWIERFTLPSRQVTTGSDTFGKVLLKSSVPTAARLVTRLTREGQVVHEDATRLHVAAAHEALFSFSVPGGATADGLHYLAASLVGDDGVEMDRRDVAVEVVNPTRVSLELEHGRHTLVPGTLARVRCHAFSERRVPPHHVTVELSLLDAEGAIVQAVGRRRANWAGSGYEDTEFELQVPPLRPGAYRLRAELRFGDGLADASEQAVRVLAGAGAAQRFPLIAEGAYHLDRASVDAAVESLCAVGVNTLSLPGPVREAWGERRHAELMLAYTEEQALRAGLALAHHRRSLVPGRQPGEPLEPCPLTADFRRALDEHTRPMLAAADRVPRLLLHEIAPESAVRPEQLCRCAACRTAYERSFGGEMPAPGATADEPGSHHALCSFVSSYWWHVYSLLRKVRSEVAAGVRLSLPFGSDSFLREAGEATYCDAFSWLRACEVAEVLPERDAARYRLSLSGHRALCAALGKPLGALIELGNPCLPPAETAYTALANGASHLRVAGNPRFLFGRRQPPLERGLGRLFARIAKAGPLLARSQRPRARVALLFPFTQVVDGGSEGLLGPFELLCAAFGEVDLVHQRLARDERIGAYAAVALLGTRLLPKKAARQLARFVEHGGLLLADRADLVDEKGRPLPWPDGFFGTAETPVFEGVTRRQRAFGAGRTVLFSAEIGAAYRRAVEREDVLAARALSRAVADALAARGVRPQARSASRAVEVGLRLCGGARLLVAVNHSDEPQQARVDIDPADGAIACAFDLLSGEELTVEHGEAPALDLPLAPREGGVWGLYPQRPFSLRLELRHDALVAGDALQYTASVVDEAGQAIAASHILRVFVTDPAGAERPDLGGEMTTTDGVLEVTQPLAVNDLPGQWTLCATDVLTRRIVRRTFTVAPAAPGSPGSEPADASGTSDKSDPSDQSDRSDRSDPPEGPDEPTKSSDTIS